MNNAQLLIQQQLPTSAVGVQLLVRFYAVPLPDGVNYELQVFIDGGLSHQNWLPLGKLVIRDQDGVSIPYSLDVAARAARLLLVGFDDPQVHQKLAREFMHKYVGIA